MSQPKENHSHADNKTALSRRQFMQILSALSLSWPVNSMGKREPTDLATETIYTDLDDPWLTLAQVQEHLFPADESSPGATDIAALQFLRNMLDAPDTDSTDRDFIINGVSWLNDLSVKNHQLPFKQLNETDKETVLRTIERSQAGGRWLSSMMSYLIEALLSDPVYGGNKDSKGWQWLEHIPGFPTPTANQLYFKMINNTRRRTKA